MVKMKGSHNHIVSVHPTPVVVTEKPYICTTTPKKMERALAMWGIKPPHFAYEFSILSRSHRVCEATDDSFLLPLHDIEARFHLPLHLFFCNLFKDYRCQRGEVPMLFVFQHLYQLKGTNVGVSGVLLLFPSLEGEDDHTESV
ncbi:hypothetical protein GOBAR_DD19198 [Gossypium barbadense]|nr:hypothetical protein GOBAR_DD19198 [Gossypium barbadense]